MNWSYIALVLLLSGLVHCDELPTAFCSADDSDLAPDLAPGALPLVTGNGAQDNEAQSNGAQSNGAESNGAEAEAAYQDGLSLLYPEEGELGASQAFPLFLQAAQLGHVQAQVHLGIMYGNGIGVEQNPEEAFYWYQQASFHDHNGFALNNLGLLYHQGLGTAQSHVLAYQCFLGASNMGCLQAHYNLAQMSYYGGDGVPPNLQQAFDHFSIAAHQSHAGAQHNLACIYYYGEGVEQNLEQAQYWFQQAANQGITEAQPILRTISRRLFWQRLRRALANGLVFFLSCGAVANVVHSSR